MTAAWQENEKENLVFDAFIHSFIDSVQLDWYISTWYKVNCASIFPEFALTYPRSGRSRINAYVQ